MTASRRRSSRPSSGQASLPFPMTWGGRRAHAGRPPRPAWLRSVPHAVRPSHQASHPVHLTLRARRAVGGFFRTQSIFARILGAIRNANTNAVRGGAPFRIAHFSVQANHVHLIVEANDKSFLRAGAAGLAVRMARALNRALDRRGGVWAERYHALAMTTPRHVRNTLVYVLFNARKHDPAMFGIDVCSSARWFDSFRDDCHVRDGPPVLGESESIVARPRTWLLSIGWRRHGLISLAERPA